MATTLEKIKWQIHAETSIANMLTWVIIGKLFGGWVWILAGIMILGNLFTQVKSIINLDDTDYLKNKKKA